MKNERSYRQIGVYKVLGTPFLFGENHVGNMYSKSEVAKNIKLSFDTYNQELAFQTSANVNQPLVKGPGSLDSFMLKADSFIKEDMVFHYGGLLGTSDKSYYLLSSDPSKNLVLYKKYKAVIGPTTNYIEADMRQFEIEATYYYHNKATKRIERLKPTYNAIRKELSFIPNVGELIDRQLLNSDPELALRKLFNAAN